MEMEMKKAIVKDSDLGNGMLAELISELRTRAKWLSDRHRVADAIYMQRSARHLEVMQAALEHLHGPLSIASLTARAERAEAELDLMRCHGNQV